MDRMDEELNALQRRVDALLTLTRELSAQNLQLKSDLQHAAQARAELESRMTEARERVDAVLRRLPDTSLQGD